ncbi:uncharacterized protein [Littorina saxatilis]|uniref:uncharacterized protein n=1 Tax=Littorina saxatilis TaxID=31220 RepID=UPI0038B62035
MEANEDKGWTQGLLHITYAINTSVSETTGKSPYEVVFGQPPRTHCSTLEILAKQGVLLEEDNHEKIPSHTALIVSELLEPLQTPITSSNDRHNNKYHLLSDSGIVAIATEITNRDIVHGQVVDKESQSVFEITQVVDPEFIPRTNNPFIGIRIHEVDRTNTDPKLLPCKVQTVEKKTTENGSEIVYKLFTNKGKLKNTFKQADLIDLRNVQFDTLLDVDIESLEDISVKTSHQLGKGGLRVHVQRKI